jgi:hypothetical protein
LILRTSRPLTAVNRLRIDCVSFAPYSSEINLIAANKNIARRQPYLGAINWPWSQFIISLDCRGSPSFTTTGALPRPSTIDRAIIMMNDCRFDTAEIGPVDPTLVGQRLLAQTTLRPKATHIPRQNVPQAEHGPTGLFGDETGGATHYLRQASGRSFR